MYVYLLKKKKNRSHIFYISQTNNNKIEIRIIIRIRGDTFISFNVTVNLLVFLRAAQSANENFDRAK